MLRRYSWENAQEKLQHYRRRAPEASVLYQIVCHSRDDLQLHWEPRSASSMNGKGPKRRSSFRLRGRKVERRRLSSATEVASMQGVSRTQRTMHEPVGEGVNSSFYQIVTVAPDQRRGAYNHKSAPISSQSQVCADLEVCRGRSTVGPPISPRSGVVVSSCI